MIAISQRGGVLAAAIIGGASITPVAAQDAARLEAIEQQIRSMQGELQQLRRQAARREAQLAAAQQEAERARAEAAQARAEAQSTQRRLDTAPPTSAPTSTASSSPDRDFRVSFPKNRPTIGMADGSIEASLGAQFQFDVGSWIDGPSTSGENLRRGRLLFGFKYDELEFNIAPDLGGSPDGSVELYEANLNWTPIEPLTGTVGYFKPWITLQDSMSSNDFLLLERPSIVEVSKNIAAGDGRASFGAKYSADRWFAAGYLTGNSWGDSEDTSRSDSQIGTVLRLVGRPMADDDWDLHLGASGSYVPRVLETSDGQTLRLRDWPEVRLDSRRTIDTDDIPADQAWTYGPELGLRWKNFLVQGEFIQIGVDRSEGASDLGFPGGYVEGSWVLTGEPRSYSASSAAFKRPTPSEPVSFTEGKNSGWGAWELTSRYSIIDLNDKDVEGGKQSIVGLGLSWYPVDMLRFVLQGDYVDVDKEDDSNDFFTLALRSQLAF